MTLDWPACNVGTERQLRCPACARIAASMTPVCSTGQTPEQRGRRRAADRTHATRRALSASQRLHAPMGGAVVGRESTGVPRWPTTHGCVATRSPGRHHTCTPLSSSSAHATRQSQPLSPLSRRAKSTSEKVLFFVKTLSPDRLAYRPRAVSARSASGGGAPRAGENL